MKTTNAFTFASIETDKQSQSSCNSVSVGNGKVVTINFTPEQLISFATKQLAVCNDKRLKLKNSKVALIVYPDTNKVGVMGYPGKSKTEFYQAEQGENDDSI